MTKIIIIKFSFVLSSIYYFEQMLFVDWIDKMMFTINEMRINCWWNSLTTFLLDYWMMKLKLRINIVCCINCCCATIFSPHQYRVGGWSFQNEKLNGGWSFLYGAKTIEKPICWREAMQFMSYPRNSSCVPASESSFAVRNIECCGRELKILWAHIDWNSPLFLHLVQSRFRWNLQL